MNYQFDKNHFNKTSNFKDALVAYMQLKSWEMVYDINVMKNSGKSLLYQSIQF